MGGGFSAKEMRQKRREGCRGGEVGEETKRDGGDLQGVHMEGSICQYLAELGVYSEGGGAAGSELWSGKLF